MQDTLGWSHNNDNNNNILSSVNYIRFWWNTVVRHHASADQRRCRYVHIIVCVPSLFRPLMDSTRHFCRVFTIATTVFIFLYFFFPVTKHKHDKIQYTDRSFLFSFPTRTSPFATAATHNTLRGLLVHYLRLNDKTKLVIQIIVICKMLI